MSYSTVFMIERGRIAEHARLTNAWGIAPVIWDSIFHRYVPKDGPHDHAIKDAHRVWNLWNDTRLTRCERFALIMTFNNFIVEGDRFREAADLLDEFNATRCIPEPEPATKVNYLPEVSRLLREGAGLYEGMCFWMTSVDCNPWIVHEDEGERWFDLTRDGGYYVFKTLEGEGETNTDKENPTMSANKPEPVGTSGRQYDSVVLYSEDVEGKGIEAEDLQAYEQPAFFTISKRCASESGATYGYHLTDSCRREFYVSEKDARFLYRTDEFWRWGKALSDERHAFFKARHEEELSELKDTVKTIKAQRDVLKDIITSQGVRVITEEQAKLIGIEVRT